MSQLFDISAEDLFKRIIADLPPKKKGK